MGEPHHEADKATAAQELDDGWLWGAALKATAHDFIIDPFPIKLASKTWTAVPVAGALGFPLQVCELRPASRDFSGDNITPSLFWDTDVDAPDFGDHLGYESRNFVTKEFCGDNLLTRTDGEHMQEGQLFVLFDFMRTQLLSLVYDSKMAKVGGNQQELERLKDILRKRLRPEAFHAFSEEYRRLRVAHGLSDIPSPVSTTFGTQSIAPACGSCFGDVGDDGRSLVKCGGCGKRFYCNKKCQKEDWKLHKTACSKSR